MQFRKKKLQLLILFVKQIIFYIQYYYSILKVVLIIFKIIDYKYNK
jgi:hypothetical protein